MTDISVDDASDAAKEAEIAARLAADTTNAEAFFGNAVTIPDVP